MLLYTCYKILIYSLIHLFFYLVTKYISYIVYDTVPDNNLILENQESTSKTQVKVKKQRTSTEKRLTSKYNHYR